MEALTIFGAVTGSISAASEVLKALDKAISTASKFKDAPEQAVSTLRDVKMMRANMVRFQSLLDKQAHALDRGVHIPLDDARDTFTNCVTSLDELENLLRPLSDPALQPLDLVERLEWAMKDKRIEILSKRLHDAQASLGLMLTILSHESLIEVQSALAHLPELTRRIGVNVAHLNRRSNSSRALSILSQIAKDDDDKSTIRPLSIVQPKSEDIASNRPDSILISQTVPENEENPVNNNAVAAFTARFAFEGALIASRAYRRAPDWDKDDVSCRSSLVNARALSLLSKLSSLSLGDISTISFIALPLVCTDISNTQHYQFGDQVNTLKITVSGDTQSSSGFSQSTTYPNANHAIGGLPSPPRSPTTPVREGVTRVFKSIRKALGPDTVEVKASIKPMLSPSTSPSASTPRSLPSQWSNLEFDQGSIRSQHSVPTMTELSTLRLENSEIHLFHGAGNVPCRGAIDEVYDEMRDWQLDLAASRGFLSPFRCRRCKQSLETIVQKKEPGWCDVEFWCGSSGCIDGHPELTPCKCYHRIRSLGLPTDSFFGCRVASDQELKCARCFGCCPGCYNKPIVVVEMMDDATANLYRRQHILLAAQRQLFESCKEHKDTETMEKNLKYYISQADIRLEILQPYISKRARDILEERQRNLTWRKSQFPMWKEMLDPLYDSSFTSVPFIRKMQEMMEDLDDRLERSAIQNEDYVPAAPDMSKRPELAALAGALTDHT